MEWNPTLLMGFAKRAGILDREFRSTYTAAERARDHQQKQSQAKERLLSAEVRALTGAEKQKAANLTGQLRARIDGITESQRLEKQAKWDSLTQCRMLCATIRTAQMSVLHREELEEKAPALPAVQVELGALLEGKVDFSQLAVEVNELYRAGKRAQAKKAWASLRAMAQAAEELLHSRMDALRSELTEGTEKRHEMTSEAAAGAVSELQKWQNGILPALKEKAEAIAAKSRENVDQNRFDIMDLRMKEEDRHSRITGSFQAAYPPVELETEYNYIRRREPGCSDFRCPERMPEQAYLADMELRVLPDWCIGTTAFLERNYPWMCRGSDLVMPYSVPFDHQMNSLFRYGDDDRKAAVELARDLALRLYMMTVPGKMRITFVDPVSLGESFAMFSRLADNGTEDNVIGGKIWSSRTDIERQLQRLTGHISDVMQRCLQGRYEDLAEYNRVSAEPEAYQVLMLMDYPAGLTEQSMKLLEKILRMGPKCGVFTMVLCSESQYRKSDEPCSRWVRQLEPEFRKWDIKPGGRVVFENAKRPRKEICWNIRRIGPAETEHILTELRRGIYGL